MNVAIVKWTEVDGIAHPIANELQALGYQTTFFHYYDRIPEKVDLVFSFAPYGHFLQIPHQLSKLPAEQRPQFLHWNFESFPNHNIPWCLTSRIGTFRSLIGVLNATNHPVPRKLRDTQPMSIINQRMHKFRYLGDNIYAYTKGWLDLLIESSIIHTEIYNQHGTPAVYVPWGTSRDWYANLDLERDIDVLWFGKRRTKQRSRLLDKIRAQLEKRGYTMYVADNEENPFIFGGQRINFLNRSKITLGLLPAWYDTSATFRINLAAANRSLFVTEPILPHAPEYAAGKHYVSSPVDQLVEAIIYYLENEYERSRIIDSAYHLVTSELTLGNSIQTIMDLVDFHCAQEDSREE